MCHPVDQAHAERERQALQSLPGSACPAPGVMNARRARSGVLLAALTLAACTLQAPMRADRAPVVDAVEVERDAAAAYAAGQWQAAAEGYRTLLAQRPRSPEAWFRLGNAYARLGRPADAVSAYREALAHDPQLAKAWYNLGIVQLRDGAAALTRMQRHVEAGDPLGVRGAALARAIAELLERPGPHDAAAAHPDAPLEAPD